MATARLYIPVGTQTYGPIPGGVDTTEAIGSNTAEIISIAANGNVILDASFVRGNDCIKILGLAGDYTVQANAAGIVLTGKAGTPAEGASISIPAFAAGGGLKIDFLNIENVDLITTDGETYQLNGPGSADQTITGSSVGLTIAGGTTGGGNGGGGSTTIDLTVGADNLTGTSGNDTFEAIVSVNQNGEQTNQLQTGDRLNGGAGFDTLDATVQDASALNGKPVAEVVLRTTSVEHLKINAEQANSSSDDDSVELDLERAYGVQKITSSFSDADLTVYNVNTLGNGGPTDPTNGLDNGRPTASIELCMDHTAGDNVLFCASDFEVYFDADYLIPGQPSSETVLRLQLMDIDNNFLTSQPLLTNPYDRIFINLPGVPSGSDPVVIVSPSEFTDTGIAAYQKLAQSIQNGLNAAGLSSWSVSVGTTFQVVDPDGDPGGASLITGWEIVITDPSGTPLNPGDVTFGASGQIPAQTDYQKEILIGRETTTDLITSILCVNKVGQGGEGGDFIVGSMSAGGVERFILEIEGYDAGTGGVNTDQDSSIASLASTNNTLREVILWAESDVTADIVIGNGNTEGMVPNMPYYYDIPYELSVQYDDEYCGNLYPDGNPCDLTDTRNNAMRDVQLFTAAGAQGKAALSSAIDVTLWAHLSDAFTGKYLDLMDDDADARADNVFATYLFSGGNDTLNMNISKSNFAFQGAATREDFAFYADMGNGNDTVLFQIGDGQFGEPYGEYTNGNDSVVDGSLEELAQVFGNSANWYTNHMLNDNVTIVTGNGNDFVHTWGSTAANIHLGAGDDIAFTDNSGGGYGRKLTAGNQEEYGADFNCCRATWVFNAQSERGDAPEVNDLLSFGRASITNAQNVSLFVHYQDLLVQVEVGDSWGSVNGVTISDLTINQAIKDAINNHPALSAFLEAKDGPSGTLLVLSKVDGKHSRSDLGLTLGRWIGVDGNPVPLTAAQQAPGALGKLLSAYTAAQLNLLGWNTDGTPYTNGHSEPGQGARWDSEFGRDDGKKLSGVDSYNVNNNRVWGSTGSDKIALSSNATSIEHIVIKKVATEVFATQAAPDYIMNFSAAISDAVIPAVAEVQEICLSYDIDSGEFPPGDVAEQPMRITVTVYDANGNPTTSIIDIAAGATAAQMNEAIRAAVNGDLGIVATIDDNGTPADASDDCVVLTYPSGANHPLATVTITAINPTEIQTLTVSGGAIPADEVIVVSFAGFVFTTANIPAGSTDAQIAAAIETAIDAANNPLVRADLAGNVVTLNYFGDTDPATAGNAVVVSSGSQVTNIAVATTQPFTAFNPGVTAEAIAVTDGAPRIDPALGFDIFDVVDVLGVHPPSGYYFDNTQQDNSAGAEYAAVNALIDNGKNGIAIIDTLDGGAGEFAYTGSPTTELARLQQMVTAGDGVAETTGFKHIIITVRNDGVTDTSVAGNPAGNGLTANWYEVTDPTGTGNATVQYMGTMVLLGYDSEAANKDMIGDWDAMTVANFTYQTPTQLMDTYVGGIV